MTFTILATNHGRDAGWMFVNTAAVTSDLSFTSGPPPLGEPFALCGGYNAPAPTWTTEGVSADGSNCEYGLVAPGATVIDTYTTLVQGPGFATDTACATSDGDVLQTSPGYACKTAVVAVADDTSPTPTASAPGGSVGGQRGASPPWPVTTAGPAPLPTTAGARDTRDERVGRTGSTRSCFTTASPAARAGH